MRRAKMLLQQAIIAIAFKSVSSDKKRKYPFRSYIKSFTDLVTGFCLHLIYRQSSVKKHLITEQKFPPLPRAKLRCKQNVNTHNI